MSDLLDILINLFAFLLAIGVLVAFHEYGHFAMARLLKVKVLRFSIGFGKAIWRRKKSDTEYVLAAIPIGGYVKMLDEREGPIAEADQPYAFNRQPVWVRFLIVLAGPIANFLFAILAYWVVYMIGITGTVPMIGEIAPHSIAEQAGMVPGEEIIAVDYMPTRTWAPVYKQLMNKLGDEGSLVIQTKREERVKTYYLTIDHWALKGDQPDLLNALGILPIRPPAYPLIKDVREFEPASRAGVESGDLILTVNGKPIDDWKDFTDIVTRSIDKPVHITVLRDDEEHEIVFKPRARETSTGEILGFAGLVAEQQPMPESLTRLERLGPVAALKESIEKTGQFIYLTFKILGKMVVGELGLKTLSGPLSIAQGAGESISVGLTYYLGFLALISISLGVLNLLPIPILDGGHLLYYLFEWLTGKPVPDKVQLLGFKIGLFLLIFLMMVAFYNDILRMI